MSPSKKRPWTSGPGEILKHALDVMSNDSDTNRRIALILIDNAVEVSIKTYLSLPKRVTGLSLGRKALDQIAESFPGLLSALEEHAPDKLAGIDLGEIEWYHRLRNELYHQGNGLTVEREKVQVYAELAKLLFESLFEMELPVSEEGPARQVGEFLHYWRQADQWAPLSRSKGDLTSRWSTWFSAARPEEKERVQWLRELREHLVRGNRLSEDELRRAIEQLIRLLKKWRGEE